MALNFPTSPSNGDTYQQYVYDATNGVWQLDRPSSDKTPVTAVVSGASVTPSYDGTAAVYSFTSSGNIIIESAGYADVLLVGGGGSGGAGWGGGGGAGGFLAVNNAYLPAGSLNVFVGDGGDAVTNGTANAGEVGQSGKASSLGNYYAPGGGGGGGFTISFNSSSIYATGGQNGGSGGGACGFNSGTAKTGGSSVVGLGNSGGTSTFIDSAGGGGGAGSPGSNAASAGSGGNGGNGVASSITGSSVIYAGGGGGSSNSVQGTGGTGGGGDAAYSGTASSGTSNTGSGGGGVLSAVSGTSGAGGSGIVIVRINS